MWETHDSFLKHKAKIKQLRTDFEQMSNETRNVAESSKSEVQRQTKKAGEIKAQMDKMIAEKGETVKETDEYVELQQQFINATSAGTRSNTTLEKNIEWTTKYSARSNIFANLDRKLAIGATLLENKIKDFEESISIMKKDWEMAAASRGATAILKEILGPGGQNWKLEYALEFVAGRISEDLAMTAQNLEDLERNTTAFNFDSDEAYEKLLAIGNKLDAGQIDIPDPAKISNPNHKLTRQEKNSAGPLGDIF
jgi:DNA polymerase III alpha subunit (gram-positive type)